MRRQGATLDEYCLMKEVNLKRLDKPMEVVQQPSLSSFAFYSFSLPTIDCSPEADDSPSDL